MYHISSHATPHHSSPRLSDARPSSLTVRSPEVDYLGHWESFLACCSDISSTRITSRSVF